MHAVKIDLGAGAPGFHVSRGIARDEGTLIYCRAFNEQRRRVVGGKSALIVDSAAARVERQRFHRVRCSNGAVWIEIDRQVRNRAAADDSLSEQVQYRSSAGAGQSRIRIGVVEVDKTTAVENDIVACAVADGQRGIDEDRASVGGAILQIERIRVDLQRRFHAEDQVSDDVIVEGPCVVVDGDRYVVHEHFIGIRARHRHVGRVAGFRDARRAVAQPARADETAVGGVLPDERRSRRSAGRKGGHRGRRRLVERIGRVQLGEGVKGLQARG